METERIARLEAQVESLKEDVKDVKNDIKEVHSRITTQTREIVEKMEEMQQRIEEKMNASAVAAKQQHDDIQRALQEDIQSLDKDVKAVSSRVDILERWRWMIFGGAIVIGYALSHFELLAKFFK